MTEAHPIPKTASSDPKDGTRLFEEILAEPQGQAPRVVRRRARRGFLTARPLIYSLLTLAVILALFTPPAFSGFLLEISNTPAADFYDAIQSLPSNSTVLISFDYDPSLSGEMDLVSLAIVRHLIQRRINIVALSTLELGPMIAKRVFAVSAADADDYHYGDNYLNMGYLPGHESGIAQLATQGIPSGGRDFDQNQLISQYPISAKIKNIKSVPLVIELSGGEETLRIWVEQFQPRVNARIAAGVSAAVEPKAVAYRDASQLAALLSGPIGAAQYEILSNRQGEAVRRATAQSFAQITMVIVILVGNVVFWISRMMERK